MAWSVYNVKNGMSGAINRDPIVLQAASQNQNDRVAKSDLVDFLEGIFALAHLSSGIRTEDQCKAIWRRYQISMTERTSGDGTVYSVTYMIGKLDAITQFASDYKE